MADDKTLSIISAVTGAIIGVMAITPLVEEVTKNISPKLEKLVSGERENGFALLTDGQEKREEPKQALEHDAEYKKRDDEIAELKRKLAEIEHKGQGEAQEGSL